MDTELRRKYLNELIERNKGNNNLQLWERLAPMNELYNLQWEKLLSLLQDTINENKKNYSRRTPQLPR